MSFNITQPVDSELAANKANKIGDDFTNPSTWRQRMDVPAVSDARRLGRAPGEGAVVLDGITSGTVIAAALGAQIIALSDFTVWVRFRCPAANPAATAGIIGAGGATAVTTSGFAVEIRTNGSLRLTVGSTPATDVSGFVAAYAGQIVDVVASRSGAPSGTGAVRVTVNGVQVLSESAAGFAASITATHLVLGVSGSTERYGGSIWRAVLLNRALTEAEALALVSYGVDPADQWGSQVVTVGPSTLNGGFETPGAGGADVFGSWSEATTGTGAIAIGTSGDAFAGTNGCKLSRSVSGDTVVVQQSVAMVAGKRFRMAAMGRTNTTGTLRMTHAASPTLTQALTGTWTYTQQEFVALNSTSSNLAVSLDTGTTGEVVVDNVVLQRIGAVVDLDLTIGVGGYFPDRTGNGCFGDAAGGVNHNLPERSGVVTVTRTLAHGDISASTGTTRLFDLPPNCGLIRVEFDRSAAFDSGRTLNIGTAGTAAKFISAQAVDGTGIVLAASLALASESNATATPIYVQKSASTTIGSVTIRLVYEIRG